MPETTFEVRFLSQDDKTDEPPFFIGGRRLTERGMDHVEFYCSPNPGEPVKPLAKIASGGELSRLMLALKSLVLAPGVVSTLLFDEVDAGIGDVLAQNGQVVTVEERIGGRGWVYWGHGPDLLDRFVLGARGAGPLRASPIV